MDLAGVVDGDHAHNGLCLTVPLTAAADNGHTNTLESPLSTRTDQQFRAIDHTHEPGRVLGIYTPGDSSAAGASSASAVCRGVRTQRSVPSSPRR